MANSDDDYWKKIGTEHPYWGVITDEKYRGPQLTSAAKEEFMATGVDDVNFVLSAIKRFVRDDFAPRTALDFGCGVGRMLMPMTKHASNVTGIDVSSAMLRHIAANAAEQGVTNLKLFDAIPDENFDWINSYIVFQHIEPQKGVAILDALLSRVEESGAVSLHFSVFRDQRITQSAVRYSRAGRSDGKNYVGFESEAHTEMPVYEYDLSEIMYYFFKHNINTVTMHHLDHGGLHGVWIFGAKA